MRWWLNTDYQAFCVDNALVNGGMDFSSLSSDIWMIEWRDDRGEIERQDSNNDNLNGVRERFYDVTPYASLFQQFMALLPDITLVQAQQIQVELIEQIFENKREALFHQVVSAGDYMWDADDSSVTALNCAVTPHLISSIYTLGDSSGGTQNSLVAQINANYVTWQSQINGNFGTVNNNANAFNQTVNEVNSWVVDSANNAFNTSDSQVNGVVVDQLNNNILGSFGYVGDTANTINNRLQNNQSPVGLLGDTSKVSHINSNYRLTHVDQGFVTVGAISALSVSAGTIGSGALTIQWLPSGGTTPVNLTATDISNIMSGIATRRLNLQTTKNIKTNEVNAMTTVVAVINYDVTAGW
jgi:hypothetical protein